MLHLDRSSPECGWDPFVKWLGGEGLIDAVSMNIDTDTLSAEVTLNKKRAGRRYLDRHSNIARESRTVQLGSLPPLHPARKAA